MHPNKSFEIIIIGGSFAGLSAGLALGRALRSTLIIDAGNPCNRFAPESHNFLTQDGISPSEVAKKAKEQVLAYDTVQFKNGLATTIKKEGDHFLIGLENCEVFTAQKLIFATGMKDLLPSIPGFEDCWGKTIIHCPYCHGYEVRNQPTGLLFDGEMALKMGKLISQWTTSPILLTNGKATLDAGEKAELDSLDIRIIEEEIEMIEQENGYLKSVWLKNGTAIPLKALYAHPPTQQNCALPQEIGCNFTESGHVQVDLFQQTSVPGVYAAGDLTSPLRSIAMAVAAGSMAGAAVNFELINGHSLS